MAIPAPEPGLVVNYSYLWHHEHAIGREEGRKDRPCVVVLCVEIDDDDSTLVTVLPVTHRQPADSRMAVEIPQRVKHYLGLDEDRSWIVISEGNEFTWPGYDLRKLPRSQRYDFGFLPPRLFDQVLRAFVAFHRAGTARATRRT
jgi:hypothetical protein